MFFFFFFLKNETVSFIPLIVAKKKRKSIFKVENGYFLKLNRKESFIYLKDNSKIFQLIVVFIKFKILQIGYH